MTDTAEIPLGERIIEARKRAGIGKGDLAKAIRVSEKTLYNYERGITEPDTTTLRLISEFTGADIAWLTSPLAPEGIGNPPASPDRSSPYVRVTGTSQSDNSEGVGYREEAIHVLPDSQLRSMGLARIHQITVSAGSGRDSEYQLQEYDGHEILPAYVVRQLYGVEPDRLKKITISGDSMWPTLRPGETCQAILWHGEPLRDGAIYVIWSPDGLMVKRIRFDRDEAGTRFIWIWSDNAEAGRYRITPDAFERDFRVIAWVRRKEENL